MHVSVTPELMVISPYQTAFPRIGELCLQQYIQSTRLLAAYKVTLICLEIISLQQRWLYPLWKPRPIQSIQILSHAVITSDIFPSSLPFFLFLFCFSCLPSSFLSLPPLFHPSFHLFFPASSHPPPTFCLFSFLGLFSGEQKESGVGLCYGLCVPLQIHMMS